MKHPHAELMAQYAQDAMETDKPWERWEYRFGSDVNSWSCWRDCSQHNMWMEAHCSREFQYRRKPISKKPVDLSVLIDSGIDCEFHHVGDHWDTIGKLGEIDANGYWCEINGDSAQNRYCRPRMNHIHAWQGGDCPLPEGFMVNIRTVHENSTAYYLKWFSKVGCKTWGDYKNIIAFEVIGLADGYCYPWEVSDVRIRF